MRMTFALPTLLAVLCGAVAGAGDVMSNVSRVRRSPHPHHPHRVLTNEEDATITSTMIDRSWKKTHLREMQSILKREGVGKEEVECCPSVLEMVARKGGRTPTGLYVELYENGENQQRFYELSCKPEVVDKPCRFVDARWYNQSRCVQKYSYSYALVRYSSTTDTPQQRTEGHFSVPGSGGWSMDYVVVRAGCECQIGKKKKNPQRHKKKRFRRHEEDDET